MEETLQRKRLKIILDCIYISGVRSEEVCYNLDKVMSYINGTLECPKVSALFTESFTIK